MPSILHWGNKAYPVSKSCGGGGGGGGGGKDGIAVYAHQSQYAINWDGVKVKSVSGY